MAIAGAIYAEWVDRVVADMGPDALNTPIKVQLHTGVDQLDRHFDKPRYLFDALLSGAVNPYNIEQIKIAGETYIRSGDKWARQEDTPLMGPDISRAASLRDRAIRARDNRRDLIASLRRVFNADELGRIFDRLVGETPEGTQSDASLTHFELILAEAWQDQADQEHPF